MSSFPEMEWNGKWDWENLMMFGSKVSGSPKSLQLTDWGIEDGGEMDAGSFNLSGGLSGSDLGNGSSAKSSISASTESSLEDGMKTSKFGFEALKGPLDDFAMKTEQTRGEISRTSPLPEASVGSVEQLLSLNIGKRYFENSCSGGNAKSPSSVIPLPSTTAAKKTKSVPPGEAISRCQVEGCNLDLSSSKDYHRKHRVCDSHSKSPKVIIGGLERRFCQQCSRFHNLSEFDEKKRSCRRRLSDHNARRRKPHQETIQFHSSRIPSSFYGGDGRQQQMNFALNDVPLDHGRDWESSRNSKFTITTGFPLKPVKCEAMSGQPQPTGNNQLLNAINMHSNTSNGFLALNGTSSPGFNQGYKDSVFSSSSVDAAAAPDFRRALSLLSNNSSWGSSYEPGGSISLAGNPVHVTHRSSMPQTVMHPIPQSLPLASSSDYWLNTQQSTYPRVQTLTSDREENGDFEANQVFKTPYEPAFYQSPLD